MAEFSPPSIKKMTANIASDNMRVAAFLDSLPGQVDTLTRAAAKRDWRQVRKVGEEIAHCKGLATCKEIIEAARQLCAALEAPHNEAEIRRQIARLTAACTQKTQQ